MNEKPVIAKLAVEHDATAFDCGHEELNRLKFWSGPIGHGDFIRQLGIKREASTNEGKTPLCSNIIN
jgi:hypothetical protein